MRALATNERWVADFPNNCDDAKHNDFQLCTNAQKTTAVCNQHHFVERGTVQLSSVAPSNIEDSCPKESLIDASQQVTGMAPPPRMYKKQRAFGIHTARMSHGPAFCHEYCQGVREEAENITA